MNFWGCGGVVAVEWDFFCVGVVVGVLCVLFGFFCVWWGGCVLFGVGGEGVRWGGKVRVCM